MDSMDAAALAAGMGVFQIWRSCLSLQQSVLATEYIAYTHTYGVPSAEYVRGIVESTTEYGV